MLGVTCILRLSLLQDIFLCLNPNTGIPELPCDDENDSEFKQQESTAEKLLQVWKKGEKLLNCFLENIEKRIYVKFKRKIKILY